MAKAKRTLPNARKAPEFSDQEYSNHFQEKRIGLEKVLGKMHNTVGHAIIPFQVGGAVDMYRFPHAIQGTAFATMELILPDGSGPKPSRIGTYELVAFTRHRIDDQENKSKFDAIELRLWRIMTHIGHLAYMESLNPFETCEIPEVDGTSYYVVFDKWSGRNIDFEIGSKKHGLLLCIEVFPSEMKYAMENGSRPLFKLLKKTKYYPYSDLDRSPVA